MNTTKIIIETDQDRNDAYEGALVKIAAGMRDLTQAEMVAIDGQVIVSREHAEKLLAEFRECAQ